MTLPLDAVPRRYQRRAEGVWVMPFLALDREERPFRAALGKAIARVEALVSRPQGEVTPAVIEPLFTRYHVQVVFAGHDHVYERTKPQKGIQHFITGAGGKMRRGDIDMKSPLRAASYDQDNSFMVIEVDETEMTFKSISEKGEVVDSGVIKQAASTGVAGQSA